jgi:hypothetical protein
MCVWGTKVAFRLIYDLSAPLEQGTGLSHAVSQAVWSVTYTLMFPTLFWVLGFLGI